ncbi:MAG: 3-methyl-2-oxobutanoate dehydrogenase subunit VorB [Raoultibacter sp.]|jgi:2-oxoglutarate ferredoxin oxidoreductase subunit alpha
MAEKVLMKGNEAMAESAIRAGCRYFFGYPITPQTELSAYMSKMMPKIDGCFLQAESEVSAINMVYGASAAGARVMTSSSSPGISLKTEGISYMAGADLPGVIVNVQRGGPGLGSIQPSQSDYWQATRALGHGDLRVIVYAPSTVQEMADYAYRAFDAADEYRTPVMIIADGLLGQMMEPVELPEHKTELPEKPWATVGHKNQRKHNIANSLYLTADELEDLVVERFKRYEVIKENEQRWESFMVEDAEVVVVAYGASARVSRSAIMAAREKGLKVGLLRPITLWPFPVKAFDECVNAKGYLSVEMNMGQMIDDIRLTLGNDTPIEHFGRTGGNIPTPDEVLLHIEGLLEKVGA